MSSPHRTLACFRVKSSLLASTYPLNVQDISLEYYDSCQVMEHQWPACRLSSSVDEPLLEFNVFEDKVFDFSNNEVGGLNSSPHNVVRL